MPSEWSETTLGEVVTLKRGYDLPEQDRVPGPHPIVSSSGVTGRHAEAKVRGPGVITGRYGTLGEIHYITEDYWPLNTTLYVQDFHGNDPRFISYFLRSLNFQAFSDKSSVPGLNRSHLHAEPVRFPKDVDEQRAIAGVLGSLDDKIELNRRMNGTLEELAEAIFKAWFVDFEPVKAKAAGAAGFPSMPQEVFDALPTRFTDSALGPIPEGWEVEALGDGCVLTMGQSPPSTYYNASGEGLPFHQGAGTYGDRFPRHETFCTVDNRVAEPGDVLFTVRAPVGRINVADRKLIVGRGIAAIRHRRGWRSFLLYLLKHRFTVEDSIGSGTIFASVTKKDMEEIKLLVPPAGVVDAFEAVGRLLDATYACNVQQNTTLAAIRDALLPKLLSGEIRVGPVEDAADGAAGAISAPGAAPAEPVAVRTPAARRRRPVAVSEARREPVEPEPEDDAPEDGRPVPIDQMDAEDVMAAFRQGVRNRGGMEREELLRAVAHRLGYRRLGSVIRKRLKGHLRAAIRRRIVSPDGPGVVVAGTAACTDYTADELVGYVRSVVRPGCVYEWDEVVQAVARHLGFARLRETIRWPIEEAMETAIREGVIARGGTTVWRERG